MFVMQTPLEQQTQSLMREISDMKETLKEIPKIRETLCMLLKQCESTDPVPVPETSPDAP